MLVISIVLWITFLYIWRLIIWEILNDEVKLILQPNHRPVTYASLIRFTHWAINSEVSNVWKWALWAASILLAMGMAVFQSPENPVVTSSSSWCPRGTKVKFLAFLIGGCFPNRPVKQAGFSQCPKKFSFDLYLKSPNFFLTEGIPSSHQRTCLITPIF